MEKYGVVKAPKKTAAQIEAEKREAAKEAAKHAERGK